MPQGQVNEESVFALQKSTLNFKSWAREGRKSQYRGDDKGPVVEYGNLYCEETSFGIAYCYRPIRQKSRKLWKYLRPVAMKLSFQS